MKAEDIKTTNDVLQWMRSLPEKLQSKYAKIICLRMLIRSLDSFIPSPVSRYRMLTALQVLLLLAVSVENPASRNLPLRKIVPKRLRVLDAHGNFDRRTDGLSPIFEVATQEKMAAILHSAGFAISIVGTSEKVVLSTPEQTNSTSFTVPELGDDSPTFRVTSRSTMGLLGVGDSIRSDVLLLAGGEDIQSSNLFSGDEASVGTRLKFAAELDENHAAWAVLTEVYENSLHARPQNWPLITALAQKDEAFWTGPDSEVLDRIAEVMEEFERLRLLEETKALKSTIEAALPEGAAPEFKRSHNNPPELIEDAPPPEQILIIWAGLDDVEQELEQERPNKERLAKIAGWLKRALLAIISKCGDWGDKAVSAFVKVLGGGAAAYLIDKLFANGRLAEFIEQLLGFGSGG